MAGISVCAPTRVDLAGGTLDIWPLYQLFRPCATVNVAVDLNARVDLRLHEDNSEPFQLISQDLQASVTGSFFQITESKDLALFGHLVAALWQPEWPSFTLTSAARSPAGAGLGGSSSLAVAAAKAICLARQQLYPELGFPDDRELVATVADVEARLIWAPTGVQDYWAALRGGLNIIRYRPGCVDVTTLGIDQLKRMEQDLILCFSGKSRASADNNWRVFRAVFERDAPVLRRLAAIAELAHSCAAALQQGDISEALLFSEREWQQRCQLWPSIETPETRKIAQVATQAGAYFVRICGAGGGGVMALFAPPEQHQNVRVALNQAGGVVLDASIFPPQ